MKLPIYIDNGKCDLTALRNHLSTLKGNYEITVEKVEDRRTNQQNRYMWGVVYPMILKALIDAGWDNVTNTDDVHNLCLGLFARKNMVNRVTGEVVEVNASTRHMTKSQLTSYTDTVRSFAAEYLGIEIPDPIRTYEEE